MDIADALLQVCKHSFYRILEDYETKEELDTLIEIHGPENIKLILYFKFGTDGSSGHIGKLSRKILQNLP